MTGHGVADPVVSCAWVAERLDEPGLSVFDASWFMPGSPRDPALEYAAGHIPGAVRFDLDAIADHSSGLPHMMAEPADFAVAVRRLGVEATSTVVVYDSEGLFSAPRVWWNLRAMGHHAAFVLDGGLPQWVAEGRALEVGWREPPHGEFKAHADADLVRDMAAVRQALETGEAQVIDARPAGRFRGETPEPRVGLRAGHLPGALNVPWASLVKDGSLLPKDQLRGAFEAAGVDLHRPLITSCGSGVSAALLALALARLGRYDVAVYDGSWTEWGADPDAPVVTGP
jgi:thiosulfate/3-mercaptopyruvate sulfurtransferase